MNAPQSETLGLELENHAGTTLVEFPVGDDHAFSVGSSPHAGLRIDRPGIAPIEFYVQREDDALWLVPAYASADLRLDTRRVSARRKLTGRCLLEIASELMVLRVHDAHDLDAIRDVHADVLQTRIFEKQRHYVENLPAESDPTRVAMPAIGHSNAPLAYCATEAVPVVRDDDIPEWQKTVRIPVFRPKTWAGAPETRTPQATVLDMAPAKIEPERVKAPGAVAALPAPAPTVTLPADRASARRSPSWRALALRLRGVRLPAFVSSLGLMAKQRPAAVAVGAFAVALAVSFSLVAATRQRAPAPSSKPRPVASASASISIPSSAARPAASAVPSVRIHATPPAPPAASGAQPARPAPGPADAELVEAVDHLVAGRDKQAEAAYARLARRSPDQRAYAVAAALLERMATCANPETRAQVSCPKVKR